MNERGQIAMVAVAGLMLVLAGMAVLVHLARISARAGDGQTAADVAALASARRLAADPGAAVAELRAAAASAARANGAHLVRFAVERAHGVPAAVIVGVGAGVDGVLPVVGARHDVVEETARAGVEWSFSLPARSFRPVALRGGTGPGAAVAVAEAQVGWPYVWGGDSRAEGGFDCSGLVDYAYAAAGVALPGRPTAADLWRLAAPIESAALAPGDLVFVGAGSGSPHHVGMYVGGGEVVVAPHTGARVRYEPLAAGGWDGYGRLVPPGSEPAGDAAVVAAARAHQVPADVLAAELELGLATDPETAATALRAARDAGHGDLRAALVAALGSESAAALVLDRATGPVAGGGLAAGVRLLPTSAPAAPAPSLPRARGRDGSAPPAGRGWTGRTSSRLGAALAAAERIAGHVENGGRVVFQGEAGLRTVARVGLTGVAVVLPRRWQRDAAAAAGSAWDAASAAADLAAGGLMLGAAALWVARLSVIGAAAFCGLSVLAAVRSRSRAGIVFNAAQAAGYALTGAGIATAGTSLVTLGAATAEIPPLGLGLCAAGATILAASYCYRERGAIASAARSAAAAAGSALDAGRSALDALNPF